MFIVGIDVGTDLTAVDERTGRVVTKVVSRPRDEAAAVLAGHRAMICPLRGSLTRGLCGYWSSTDSRHHPDLLALLDGGKEVQHGPIERVQLLKLERMATAGNTCIPPGAACA